MRDPYLVLGVPRSADAEAIKKAYRALAKELHPDLNPGRSDVEQRFREVAAAYDLLGDADKRARFDRGEIDAAGAARADRPRHRAGAGRGGARPRPEGFSFDPDDLFSDLFRDRGGTKGGAKPGSAGAGAGGGARGSDVTYSLTIPFLDAALGAKRRIALSTGKSLEVTIPPGTRDQQKLRLRGQGLAGLGGIPPGDAIVEVWVEPHPHFTRDGADIHLEVPVSLPEAVLGASIRVPTVDGTVQVKVPPGSNTGTRLRLKGKGVADQETRGTGDQYVTLKVVLPDPPDPALAEIVEQWAKTGAYNPRRKAGLE